nr:hypothetical protein [uncultured Campylobacter sp.]
MRILTKKTHFKAIWERFELWGILGLGFGSFCVFRAVFVRFWL